MKRRDFLKTSAFSLASAGFLPIESFALPTTTLGGGSYKLENEFMIWQVEATPNNVSTTTFVNKLSGQSTALNTGTELSICIADHHHRIEIPWWYIQTGVDHDTNSPEAEEGYKHNFHMPGAVDEKTWKTTLNLLQHHFLGVYAPTTFDGYVWFRNSFQLSATPTQEPVSICLGGYDQQDWHEYWVWINGKPVAQWKKETTKTRWQDPRIITLHPGTPEYDALQFGKENLIAVRTYKVDKSCIAIHPNSLTRYAFDGRLCDQYLTVGKPFTEINSFQVMRSGMTKEGNKTTLLCELQSEQNLELKLYYQLEGPVRRKWFELKNHSDHAVTVLDVELDRLGHLDALTEGDFGDPVILKDGFCAVEHPAGLSQLMSNGEIRLRHFPGKVLNPNEGMTSKVALVVVSQTNKGKESFLQYLEQRTPRKGLRAIYDTLGIRGLGDDPCWVLNDDEMIESVEHLETLKKSGVSFDYFVPDVGWQDQNGDLTTYWPQCFPNGAKDVAPRVRAAGMKWGLWFTSTWADWSSGQNPTVVASRTLVAGGEWPPYKYRNEYYELSDQRQFCLASEPYRTQLKKALLWHIREERMDFFKFDCGMYYCNNPAHEHLAGKYSVEPAYDAAIDYARAVHEIAPEIYIMWYWGIRSPFFALHGDSIFESRYHLEAESTGDVPALFYRDAVTVLVDQGTFASDLIPQRNKDSLGIELTDIMWGGNMRKERWREALVMDLGRGNLLFPQFWGNINYFSEKDIIFLARIQAFARQNEQLLSTRHKLFGDPWKAEVYGYSYSNGHESLIFANNIYFEERKLVLKLDESLGIKPGATNLHLESFFPEEARLLLDGRESFTYGDTLELWLRPFEITILRIATTPNNAFAPASTRQLTATTSDKKSLRFELKPAAHSAELEVIFGDPNQVSRSSAVRPTLKEFAANGFVKRVWSFETTLPADDLNRHMIVYLLRFYKEGKLWHYNQTADLVQTFALIGEQRLTSFETVPNYRQTSYDGVTPWLVFRIRANSNWSAKPMKIEFTAYLPPDVEVKTEGWAIPEWWGAELTV